MPRSFARTEAHLPWTHGPAQQKTIAPVRTSLAGGRFGLRLTRGDGGAGDFAQLRRVPAGRDTRPGPALELARPAPLLLIPHHRRI